MSVLGSSVSKRGRGAAADAASGRPRPPFLVRYAWGSWLCNFCDGVNRPEATSCEVRSQGFGAIQCLGLRKYSKRYAEPVDLNAAPEWYRQEVAAEQHASAKQEKRKHTQSVLDAVLIRSGWNFAGISQTGRNASGAPQHVVMMPSRRGCHDRPTPGLSQMTARMTTRIATRSVGRSAKAWRKRGRSSGLAGVRERAGSVARCFPLARGSPRTP